MQQGVIYEGRWQIVKRIYQDKEKKNYHVLLENIYNHETIELGKTTISNIDKGLTTVSHVLKRRAKKLHRKNGLDCWYKGGGTYGK